MNKAIVSGVLTFSFLGLVAYGLTTTTASFTPTIKTETSTNLLVTTNEVGYPGGVPTLIREAKLPVRKISPGTGAVLTLNTAVTKETVDSLIADLEAARSSGKKTVYIVIDSPGGSVLDGAKLLSYMKSSNMEINTVCETLCASMAFHIFEAGHKRLMLDKSVLMAHSASGGANGTVENMAAMINMLKLYVDRMDADVAARAGISMADFKVRVLNNMWLEARDAVPQKFADEIVTLEYSKGHTTPFVISPDENSDDTKRIIDLQ